MSHITLIWTVTNIQLRNQPKHDIFPVCADYRHCLISQHVVNWPSRKKIYINFCERNKAHLNDCSAQNLQSHKRGNCLLKCIVHIMTSYSWGYYTGESSPRPLYTGPNRCMYFLTKSLALFFTESLTSKSSTCRQYFSSLSKTACVSWNAKK